MDVQFLTKPMQANVHIFSWAQDTAMFIMRHRVSQTWWHIGHKKLTQQLWCSVWVNLFTILPDIHGKLSLHLFKHLSVLTWMRVENSGKLTMSKNTKWKINMIKIPVHHTYVWEWQTCFQVFQEARRTTVSSFCRTNRVPSYVHTANSAAKSNNNQQQKVQCKTRFCIKPPRIRPYVNWTCVCLHSKQKDGHLSLHKHSTYSFLYLYTKVKVFFWILKTEHWFVSFSDVLTIQQWN